MANEHKLNERQRRFVDEYIITGVAETAALNAGYSEKYARAQSHKLLANVGISKYLEERNKVLESDKIATMIEVKEFWTNTMRDSESDLKDKLKASEYIAKTNGAFIDKQDTTVNGGVSIKVEWLDDNE